MRGTDIANCTFMSQFGQRLKHFRRYWPSGRGEGVIDIEETDGFLERTILEIGVKLSHFKGM